ncbi:Capsule polysaccharide biosynthesis protein [Yoonia tamlensis]|uniref:Capsule polysaccharide biosynthesis protein n=1 Tax=Yoonia tamlensis TaxID=390270 RepID=A0A1I6HH02_9RHOB|nr:hypothetical protein [Yoonia tamlensis]SFR53765.1 Capsule polysaccharide biosynthesis protein [Yoonia tamlensis]
MVSENTVTFYLNPKMRRQAERGEQNFVHQTSAVLTAAGFDIAFDTNDELGRLQAISRPGRSLFLMDDPVDARGLTLRKTYVGPFWHIEKQSERWKWPVAKVAFSSDAVNAAKAAAFYQRWRGKLFWGTPKHAGFVFMPLQGRLLTRRSFQSCSPIEMIKTTLEHEPKREIIATLHPSETYQQAEIDALDKLTDRYDQFSVQSDGADTLLRDCDYVVTQNSSLGFHGYFLQKPLILFGKSDFHHIALNVHQMGAADAFAARVGHAPDYAAYLFWFLQKQAINAGRPETRSIIRNVFLRHGWPV